MSNASYWIQEFNKVVNRWVWHVSLTACTMCLSYLLAVGMFLIRRTACWNFWCWAWWSYMRTLSIYSSPVSFLHVVIAFYVLAFRTLQSCCCALFSNISSFMAFYSDASKESIDPKFLLNTTSQWWLLIGWSVRFAIPPDFGQWCSSSYHL